MLITLHKSVICSSETINHPIAGAFITIQWCSRRSEHTSAVGSLITQFQLKSQSPTTSHPPNPPPPAVEKWVHECSYEIKARILVCLGRWLRGVKDLWLGIHCPRFSKDHRKTIWISSNRLCDLVCSRCREI